LAVAPAGSVLLAVAVGADFVALEVDFAAVVAGAGAGAAAAGGAADVVLVAFCTPPCPLHAPLPVADEVVPSLQVVRPSLAGVAAGAGAPVDVDELAAFWTPPCPLHAPLPVALEVVPSLHTVASAA
jgi:hypothetical protein